MPPSRARGVWIELALAETVLTLIDAGMRQLVRNSGGLRLSDEAVAMLYRLHYASETYAADEHDGPVRVVREESVAEAAERMGCSVQYVRRLLAAGRINGRRIGRTWIVVSQPQPDEAGSAILDP